MTAPLHATPRELWNKIRDKRRSAWLSGQRVRVETIVRQLPALADDSEVLTELVYQEYCLRQEQGEQPSLGDFQQRFPQCAAALQSLCAEIPVAAPEVPGVRETIEFPAAGSTYSGVQLQADLVSAAEDRPGGKRFGRYRIIDQLGEGAMGVVYLARDTRLDRPVALKLPRFSPNAVHDGLRTRFYREARAAAAIDHPNICPVYDLGEIDGQDYIAMAYVAGPTLEAMMRECGPLGILESFVIIRDVARALDECHLHGVIHRDLKPSNIVINQRGTPIVMDFGLASMENAARVTVDQQVLGTLHYMSPEQVTGNLEEVGPRSDIYSLGATLYEAITAYSPFTGSHFFEIANRIENEPPLPPSQFIVGLAPEVDQILLKALAKSPDQRFQSMSEFAEALNQHLV